MSRLSAFRVLPCMVGIFLSVQIARAQDNSQNTDFVTTRLRQISGDLAPLRRIAECGNSNAVYKDHDLLIVEHGPTLALRGKDMAGHAWNAQLNVTGLGCEIYKSDLDGNGQDDLVIEAPGISDRGSYGSSLTILLFDAAGRPNPWQAVGQFTAEEQGIREIRRDAKGIFLVHTSQVGLAAWDGLTYISNLYRFADAHVVRASESYARIDFPRTDGAAKAKPRIMQAAKAINLSTRLGADEFSPVKASDPQFLRYGVLAEPPRVSANPSSQAEHQPTIANPAVDVTGLLNAVKKIVASDGSALELPDILVVDNQNGTREIVFQPEDEDFNHAAGKGYRMHPMGMDCTSADDCQPFILWLK